MKLWTLILLIITGAVVYHFAFEYLTNKQIVFGFMGLVTVTILFFSLRLCFVDKEKQKGKYYDFTKKSD